MDINFNVAFLKTVLEPLMTSIECSLINIQENIDAVKDNNVTNGSLLQINAIDKLHEAKNVLKMIDLIGLYVILDKTEQLLKSLKEGKLNKDILGVLQVSKNFLEEVKIYIDQLKLGNLDNPNKLFVHYKLIMKYLGSSAVSSYDLFFPKIDLLRKESQNVEKYYKLFIYDQNRLNLLKSNLSQLVQKVSTDVGAIEWQENLYLDDLVQDVFLLQELKINKHWHILLSIVASYLSVMQMSSKNSSMGNWANEKSLLEQFSKELSTLNEAVQEATVHSIKKIRSDKEFQKEILYSLVIVLHANGDLQENDLVKELNKLINLDSYLAQIDADTPTEVFVQVDPSLVDSLTKVFQSFKDEFIHFIENENKEKDFSIVNKCDEIYLLLKKLNLPESSNLIRSIKDLLNNCINGDIEKNTFIIDELSLAINFLERLIISGTDNLNNKTIDPEHIRSLVTRINKIVENKGNVQEIPSLPQLPSLIKENEQKRAKINVYKQLMEDLTEADDIINNFFRTKGENRQDITKVVDILNSSRGILAMTGKAQLGALMQEASKVFQDLMLSTKGVSVENVRKVSNYIAAVHLYSEAVSKDNKEESESIYYQIIEMVEKDKHDAGEGSLVQPVLEIKKQQLLDLPSSSSGVVVQEIPMQMVQFEDEANNEELCEIFLLEFKDVISSLEQDLMLLEYELQNVDLFKNVRRYFHTLKGSSRMIGFKYFAEAPWLVEQMLNKKIEIGEYPDEKLIEVLRQVSHLLSLWIDKFIEDGKQVLHSNAVEVEQLILPFNNKVSFSFDLSKVEKQEVREVEEIFQKEMSILLEKIKLKSENRDFFILNDEGIVLLKNIANLAKVSRYNNIESIVKALLTIVYDNNKNEILDLYPVESALLMIEDFKNHINVSHKVYEQLLSDLENKKSLVIDVPLTSDAIVSSAVVQNVDNTMSSVKNLLSEKPKSAKEKLSSEKQTKKEEGIYMSQQQLDSLLSSIQSLNEQVQMLAQQNNELKTIIEDKLNDNPSDFASGSEVDLSIFEEKFEAMEEQISEQHRVQRLDLSAISNLLKEAQSKAQVSDVVQSINSSSLSAEDKEHIKAVIGEMLLEHNEELKNYFKKITINAMNHIRADLSKKKGIYI